MSKQSVLSWRASGASLGVALLLAVIGWLSVHQPVLAQSDQPAAALATITVNTDNPAISDDGNCSIIEAIENANADALVYDDCTAGSGSDTIDIDLPITSTITFTTEHNTTLNGGNGLPPITSTITISGNGVTLVRAGSAPLFRFFEVLADGNLTLDDVDMRNGRVGIPGTTVEIHGGGAVYNQGILSILNSLISSNQASYGGAIASETETGSLTVSNTELNSNSADSNGGAIYTNGAAVLTNVQMRSNHAQGLGGAMLSDSSVVSVIDSTVQGNTSEDSGGGIAIRAIISDSHVAIQGSSVISNVAAVNGGGIYQTANNGAKSQLDITGGNISSNSAESTLVSEGIGGGIFNGWNLPGLGGTALVNLSQVSVLDNVARAGGGIANLDATGLTTRTATLFISQSTLARNNAQGTGSGAGSGGGLYNLNGDATLANSTVSNNQADGNDTTLGGRGGGIANLSDGVTSTVHLRNATIGFNAASQAGGGIAIKGLVSPIAAFLDTGNSLIAGNTLSVTQAASVNVIAGTGSCSIENGQTNSLGYNTEDLAKCGLNGISDVVNTPVTFAPLANNGGPTDTLLIQIGGPGFDSALDSLCAAPPVNGVDQRGINRPQGLHCDRGAVELELSQPPKQFFPQIYKFFDESLLP